MTLANLVNHTGLGMHYVHGFPLDSPLPSALQLISGSQATPAPGGYACLDLVKEPGTEFGYSGGGFLVLQHLLEARESRPMADLLKPFLAASFPATSTDISFDQEEIARAEHAIGYRDGGGPVQGGRLQFPPLAAGASGSAEALLAWLSQLATAYTEPGGCGPISHATAKAMLSPGPDQGSLRFMAAGAGLGVFVLDTSEGSRWMLHQAANDGFRGLYLVCFAGPGAAAGPTGLVILANGDNSAVPLICAVARRLLESPNLVATGLDWSRVPAPDTAFSVAGLRQEEIVNLGYKELLLNAFV